MWKKKETYWTIEKSKEEAKKYQHKVDFKKNSNRAYVVLRENGLLDESCSHMTKPDMSKIWSEEKVLESAKLCKSRSEFRKKFPGAERWAKKHGIYETILNLFDLQGSRYKRCIYAYEFPDNYVYVGLTYNLHKRDIQHNSNFDSKVFQHINSTGLKPELKQITDYLEYTEASKMEGIVLENYIKNGWQKLNACKTGGLGSLKIKKTKKTIKKEYPKLTYDYVLECAKKCKTKTEFQKKYVREYNYVLKNKLMEKIESEYQFEFFYHKRWTIEECQEEAKKFNTRNEFYKNMSGCYQVALKNGWLDEICSHMVSGRKPLKYTEDNVKEEVKKHHRFSEMRNSQDSFIKGCYWWIKSKKLFNDYKQYLKNEQTDI